MVPEIMNFRKFVIKYELLGGFPDGSAVKNPPAMQKTQEIRV